MTHHVFFFAERAFLAFGRTRLEPGAEAFSIEDGAVTVIAIAAALEATVNGMFAADGRLQHFDELRLSSKIETLADWGKVPVDWGANPWQSTAELIRVRNWLVHFKDSHIGLTSLSEGWVDDLANKRPKMDPFVHLAHARVVRYLKAATETIEELARGLWGPDVAQWPEFLRELDGDSVEVW